MLYKTVCHAMEDGTQLENEPRNTTNIQIKFFKPISTLDSQYSQYVNAYE